MSLQFLEALDGAEHEQVQILQEPEIGFYALLAIHDTRNGPAFGGVRRLAYRNGAEALRDVLLLSRAMTYKCLMAGVAGGGGKVVLLDLPETDLEQAYRRIGYHVENMGGRYYTGPDVGTGPRELSWLSQTTGFVTRPDETGPGDLGRATARGVFAGIGALCRQLSTQDKRYPSDPAAMGMAGVRVLVQGLGEAGGELAAMLGEAGASVLAAELKPDVLEWAVDQHGVEPVDPEEVYETECDIFAPCALGGVLHDLTVGRLRCKAIGGSANNILARPEIAHVLQDRGILVAPDFVINSGALILGAGFHLSAEREQGEAIDRIGEELMQLFERAEREGVPPPLLAEQIAEERLGSKTGKPWFPKRDRERMDG
jgi:leucine dehydrogenase